MLNKSLKATFLYFSDSFLPSYVKPKYNELIGIRQVTFRKYAYKMWLNGSIEHLFLRILLL